MCEDLERQVVRGSLFTHTALSQNSERLTEVEAVVYGLLDLLIAGGIVDEHAVADAAVAIRTRLEERGETVSPGVALRVDGDIPKDAVTPVNCAERLHVCHAVCCRLRFALSADEVESAVAQWDLGQPYQIRQSPSGTCVHNDPATGDCGIYADRPGVCRRYNCANDERIWSDFDRMKINQAWIDENLSASTPRLANASMVWLDPPALRRSVIPLDPQARKPDPEVLPP
jgi:Fe-S-cluster containining protein